MELHHFTKCMLHDYEVGDFKRKWAGIISKFDIQNRPWVVKLFQKRKLWCTAFMRGSFSIEFNITLRCEALHSQIGKYP